MRQPQQATRSVPERERERERERKRERQNTDTQRVAEKERWKHRNKVYPCKPRGAYMGDICNSHTPNHNHTNRHTKVSFLLFYKENRTEISFESSVGEPSFTVSPPPIAKKRRLLLRYLQEKINSCQLQFCSALKAFHTCSLKEWDIFIKPLLYYRQPMHICKIIQEFVLINECWGAVLVCKKR